MLVYYLCIMVVMVVVIYDFIIYFPYPFIPALSSALKAKQKGNDNKIVFVN